MACDISRGRLEACKDSVGGINAVYFVNKDNLGAITYDTTDTDVIESVAGTPDAYKFEVRGASTYTETPTSSRENGTTFFEQVLELQLPKLTKEDHQTVKLLAFGSPHVIIEDNNKNLLLAFLEYGGDITGGSIATGAAMGDMSGYTLTFTGMEKIPANFIASTGVPSVDLAAAGFTVVSGT
tara:strand:+ start:345 stop:890 length:546 start_codon:yes stop_codon:yes gene_type:complete